MFNISNTPIGKILPDRSIPDRKHLYGLILYWSIRRSYEPRTYLTSIWARMSDFITSQTFHIAKCISTFVHMYKWTQHPRCRKMIRKKTDIAYPSLFFFSLFDFGPFPKRFKFENWNQLLSLVLRMVGEFIHNKWINSFII